MSSGVYVPSTQEKDLAKYALALQQLAMGRSNATGSVTLTASATSTVVTPENCAAGSAVFLFPKTANAAAALSTTYVGTVAKQSFTITHANAASVDRTFFYVALG
jgi:hypothetical protein